MKINLLPGRIHDKAKLRVAWVIVALLLAAQLAGLIFYQTTLLAQEKKLAADVEEAKTKADAVNQLATDAQNERAKIASIDAKVTFVQQLQEYNERRPDLYNNTAEYTLEGIKYASMSASQNLLTLSAWAPTLADAGRYLLYMQNSPDFTAVRISAVPGYPTGGQGAAGGSFGDSGGAGAPISSGFSGDPGAGLSGGFAGGNSGGFGPGGGAPIDSGGGFGPSPGAPIDSGGGFAPGGPGDIGPGAEFGGGGFGVGGGGGGGNTVIGGAFMNAGARNRPPEPPRNFQFQVSAVLAKPITRPIFGPQQQQPGFGGGAFGDPYGSGFAPGGVPGGGFSPGLEANSGGFAPGAPPPGMASPGGG